MGIGQYWFLFIFFFQKMGMGIGVGDGEGEGLRPEFTPYYRTPRKEALQLRGEIADAHYVFADILLGSKLMLFAIAR